MLKSLKELFDRMIAPASESPQQVEHGIHLATGVLLVEVMRSDPEISEAERRAVVDALRSTFALSADEGAVLLELAEQTSREATDLFSFTTRINESFSAGQKVEMIESMWRVAYADGKLDAHENHVMRRFADLLHVPHGAYANAKMRARDAPEPGGP